MKTSAERGREVRRKLLDAAADLIPERGWTAVSTRVLAERTGVAPGLVHYHFPSLQALLSEAALDVIRRVVAETGPLLERAETLDDGLAAMFGALDAFTGSDPVSVLFTETYLAAARDEDLRRELTALVTRFRRELVDWLRARGQETPEETASVLAAALDGMMLHRPLNPELTSAAVMTVLRRLLTRPGGDDRRAGG
ncbi:TetR/AcrR family transcriptional regulator [Streptosporangium sandarakinum]|uniref:TetR/AcrR family transcriptional regulator n=1 Tax=Streptosporangium sandarakinum TaxID=1260955 RepID=UPI00369D1A5C